MQITMKQARVGANLTQADVAAKMGVHTQTYMRLEKHSGDMKIKQAKKFAKIVGLNFDDIFFGNEV